MKESESPWKSINQELPPEDPFDWVVVWLYEQGIPMVMKSNIAMYSAVAALAEEWVTWDRRFNYWKPLALPPQKKKKPKLKRVRKRKRDGREPETRRKRKRTR